MNAYGPNIFIPSPYPIFWEKDSAQEELQVSRDQTGQGLIEFILLLLVIVMISGITLRGLNGQIAKRWEFLIQNMAGPTPTQIKIP